MEWPTEYAASNSEKLSPVLSTRKKNPRDRTVSKNSEACKSASLNILKYMEKVRYSLELHHHHNGRLTSIYLTAVMGDDEEEEYEAVSVSSSGEDSDYDIVSAVEKALTGDSTAK